MSLPLFGSSNRATNKNLVEFKAGKMYMKGKMVYPDKRKGLTYLYQAEDKLMHFCWMDRSTGTVEGDLIIFPNECEYKKVPQCTTGRVYVLRFKSDKRRIFLWMQEPKIDKDEVYSYKINEYLNNPPNPRSHSSISSTLRNMLRNSDLSDQQRSEIRSFIGNLSRKQLKHLLGKGVSSLAPLLEPKVDKIKLRRVPQTFQILSTSAEKPVKEEESISLRPPSQSDIRQITAAPLKNPNIQVPPTENSTPPTVTIQQPNQTPLPQIPVTTVHHHNTISNHSEVEFFVLSPIGSQNFSKNDEKLYRFLRSYIKIQREDVKRQHDGTLLIKTRTQRDSLNLKKINTLLDCPVVVTHHPHLNQSQGTIYCPKLLPISTSELLDDWQSQDIGVKAVYRFSKKVNNINVPSPRLLLTFETLNLPTFVWHGFQKYSVRPYVPAPRRCSRCQKFGHVSKFCRSPELCHRCGASSHPLPCENPASCVNCGGAHQANDPNCLVYTMERKIMSVKTSENLSLREARIKVQTMFISQGRTDADEILTPGNTPNMHNLSSEDSIVSNVNPSPAPLPSSTETQQICHTPSSRPRPLSSPSRLTRLKRFKTRFRSHTSPSSVRVSPSVPPLSRAILNSPTSINSTLPSTSVDTLPIITDVQHSPSISPPQPQLLSSEDSVSPEKRS